METFFPVRHSRVNVKAEITNSCTVDGLKLLYFDLFFFKCFTPIEMAKTKELGNKVSEP